METVIMEKESLDLLFNGLSEPAQQLTICGSCWEIAGKTQRKR